MSLRDISNVVIILIAFGRQGCRGVGLAGAGAAAEAALAVRGRIWKLDVVPRGNGRLKHLLGINHLDEGQQVVGAGGGHGTAGSEIPILISLSIVMPVSGRELGLGSSPRS